MKLLFVTPYLPSPPKFGGQRRLHGLMRAAADEHEVSVVALADPSEDAAESVRATREYCRRVVTVNGSWRYARGARKRAIQVATLLSPWSYEWAAYRARALQSELDALASQESFDVIQFEFAQMAIYRAPSTRKRPVVVLDEHNIEFDVVRRTAEADVGAVRRAFSTVNWRKLRREERASWRRFDGCVLTSTRDREMLLSEQPGVRSCVVPNGVDVEEFAPDPRQAPEPDTVLFFGAVGYYPNTDGLLFFLREVWPILEKSRPGIRLRIVGPDPPAVIASWAGPAVEVTGYVEDIRAAIAAASVVVVPLRIGGGTRLKVVEAMALGKAMVSTTIGAEGIDVVHGRHALIADGAADFARSVLRLLDNRSLAGRLGSAARQLAVERYSWRAATDRLLAFYSELGASV